MRPNPRYPDQRRQFGQFAEQLAEDFLCRRGLRILFRNYRCPLGELDLVARDGDTLVFMEVRATASGDMMKPAISVDEQKQRRLLRLADYFLAKHRLLHQPVRFDVVLVVRGVPASDELPTDTVFEAIEHDGQRIGLVYYRNAFRYYA